MEAAVLNPTQMHLLKLFSFNNSEEYAREIQMVLTRHFQSQLDAEADRLWDEGILNQEKLDEIRQEDLHAVDALGSCRCCSCCLRSHSTCQYLR